MCCNPKYVYAKAWEGREGTDYFNFMVENGWSMFSASISNQVCAAFAEGGRTSVMLQSNDDILKTSHTFLSCTCTRTDSAVSTWECGSACSEAAGCPCPSQSGSPGTRPAHSHHTPTCKMRWRRHFPRQKAGLGYCTASWRFPHFIMQRVVKTTFFPSKILKVHLCKYKADSFRASFCNVR